MYLLQMMTLFCLVQTRKSCVRNDAVGFAFDGLLLFMPVLLVLLTLHWSYMLLYKFMTLPLRQIPSYFASSLLVLCWILVRVAVLFTLVS